MPSTTDKDPEILSALVALENEVANLIPRLEPVMLSAKPTAETTAAAPDRSAVHERLVALLQRIRDAAARLEL